MARTKLAVQIIQAIPTVSSRDYSRLNMLSSINNNSNRTKEMVEASMLAASTSVALPVNSQEVVISTSSNIIKAEAVEASILVAWRISS